MKYLYILFGVFALLFVGAYWFSNHKYDKGEGLEASTESQVLIQYQTVAHAGLKVDVRPLVQADRVSYGAPAVSKFELRNLSGEQVKFRLRYEVLPAGNEHAFHWTEVLALEQSLQANEVKSVSFPYELYRDHTQTTDGTLTFKVFLEP